VADPISIDYLSRDYSGLRQSLLTFAQQNFPEWTPASEGDLGVMLIEAMSYVGDILSYYTDRAQLESYLPTATQRESILAIAYMLGYIPTSGNPAVGTVTLENRGPKAIVVPGGLQIHTGVVSTLDSPVVFEVNDTEDDALRTVPAMVGSVPGTLVVNVTEGETVEYLKIGESTGLPSQVFALPDPGVYPLTLRIFLESPSGSTQIPVGSTLVTVREWLRKDYLLEADSDELAFEANLAATDATSIMFGDGINGQVPPAGVQIYATYRHGSGAAGNVAAGQVYLINTTSIPEIHVAQAADETYLSSAMTGGADAESAERIRYNAPRAYRTQYRAVTRNDFRDLALGVEGVAKANVLVGSFTSVVVYITAADGGLPSETLKDVVAQRLQDAALAGVDVTVANPSYVPVNFGSVAEPIQVEVWPQYSQKNVKAGIRTAINTYVTNMEFGAKLTVGEIFQLIRDVEGVRYVDITMVARNDTLQTGTQTINPRPWEILTVGALNIFATGGVA
jgi:uncharacterized phage protein gp47/JayE